MITSAQNTLLNKLISDSQSHMAGSQGKDVAYFVAEGSIEKVLTANGFSQNIKQAKDGSYFGHTSWWNDECQALVTNVPRSNRWGITFVNCNHTHVLTSADYAEVQ